MACRRADTTSFVRCFGSGSPWLCNCQCWECFRCLKTHVAEHDRENLLTQSWRPEHIPPEKPHGKGRTGLYSASCNSLHRPKFICPRPTCRRSIKPFYAPHINEYYFKTTWGREEWGKDWSVRPLSEREPALAKAMENMTNFTRAPPELKSLPVEQDRKVIAKYKADPHSLSDFERVVLPWIWPDSWFIHIVKRCPGCGQDVVPVGSNFRIPARKDKKGWRQVEAWIEAGEDLEAKFVLCATVAKHKERVAKAIELRAEKGIQDQPHPRDRNLATCLS